MHLYHHTAAVAVVVAAVDVIEITVEQIVVAVVVTGHRSASASATDQHGNARSTAGRAVAAVRSGATGCGRRCGLCLCDIDFDSVRDDTGREVILHLDVAIDRGLQLGLTGALQWRRRWRIDRFQVNRV